MKSIDVTCLRKEYGMLVAVNDVSFALESGQVLGLVGPNGAGKTTLLRMLATIMRPTRGNIRMLDQWRSQATPWYVTWGIVYEFVRVVTHPRVLNRPFAAAQAWRFLDALFASPSLRV